MTSRMNDQPGSTPNQSPATRVNRRGFMKITAVCGLALTAGTKLLLQLAQDRGAPALSQTRMLMGTLVNLTVLFPQREQDQAVLDNTFKRMEDLIAIFDHRLPSSPVARLNREGMVSDPPQALLAVLSSALHIARLTDGAFDPTIKPVLDAYRSGVEAGDDIRSLVGWQRVAVQDDRIAFSTPGMQITLDGIAKGAVIDAGAAALREHGCNSVLVEAGGDLIAAGSGRSGNGWNIGVRHPRGGAGDMLLQLPLSDMAAATSGDYQYTFSTDYSLHHIIDPHSCGSPQELASVSVLAPDAMQADALSTAVFVLGKQAGLALIESLPGFEGILVSKKLEIVSSSGIS